MPKDLESLKKSREFREYFLKKYGEIPYSVWEVDYSKNNTFLKRYFRSRSQHAKSKLEKLDVEDPLIKDMYRITFQSVRGKEGGLSVFPFDVAERIIKFYSEPYDIILDPCCGHVTRMTASFVLNRNYIGYDVSKEFMKHNRNVLKELVEWSLVEPDIAVVLKEKSSEFIDEPTDSIDLIFTSPPYWDIEFYGDEPEQLGWNKTYEEFLDGLKRVMMQCFRVLKPEHFCIFNVNDFRKEGVFYTYHDDVIQLAKRIGFLIHDIIIINWGRTMMEVFATTLDKLKISAKLHEYLIVMKKPTKYHLVWDRKIYKPNIEPCPKCGSTLVFDMISETHESAKCSNCGYSVTRFIKQDGVMPRDIVEALERRKRKEKAEIVFDFADDIVFDFE